MLCLIRTFSLLLTLLVVGCATGPSGITFDSPVGDWREKIQRMNGNWRSGNLTIIDETKATYMPNEGQIFFYAIDDQGKWEGHWVVKYYEDVQNQCLEEKHGSENWGVAIFQFNDAYNKYEGTWDMCGKVENTLRKESVSECLR